MTSVPFKSMIWSLFMASTLIHASLGQLHEESISEHELITLLQSRNVSEIVNALEYFQLNYSDTEPSTIQLADGSAISAPVRRALIEALAYDVEQYGAATDGKPYDADYLSSIPDGGILLSEVIALRDEATIPVLLLNTGYGWAAVYALLDFGPMVISPAIECAENDEIWTQAVTGCLMLLRTAVRIWENQIPRNEITRMNLLVHRYLSQPIMEYSSEFHGTMCIYGAADLALALGWTDEFRALTRARLDEIDPDDSWVWIRDGILKSLSGELSSPSVAKVVREWKQ